MRMKPALRLWMDESGKRLTGVVNLSEFHQSDRAFEAVDIPEFLNGRFEGLFANKETTLEPIDDIFDRRSATNRTVILVHCVVWSTKALQ